MQPERSQLLQSLIWLHEPLDKLSERLTKFERGFYSEPVVVETDAVKTVLMRYLRAYISAQELEHWANLIECREDIVFEEAFSEQIEMIIHLLASPEINDGINSELCSYFLDTLGTTPLDSLIQDLAVRSELVHVCQLMKSDRIELIYGCRKIIQLSHCLTRADQELFLTFVGVASECDDYPDHDKKKLFSQKYLEQVSNSTRLYETKVSETVLDACDAIIRLFWLDKKLGQKKRKRKGGSPILALSLIQLTRLIIRNTIWKRPWQSIYIRKQGMINRHVFRHREGHGHRNRDTKRGQIYFSPQDNPPKFAIAPCLCLNIPLLNTTIQKQKQ